MSPRSSKACEGADLECLRKSKDCNGFGANTGKKTGKATIDHREVAKFAIKMGWKPPKPKDPIDLLAKEISEAARVEERTDKKSGLAYRANLSYMTMQGSQQLALWVDVDEANRFQVDKFAKNHREQLVGEAYRWANTIDHWNRTHPNEEPVQAVLDLGPDVEWRRNAPGEDEKAS